MKTKDSRCLPAFLAILLIFTVTAPAYAYLDPGTGSVVYQAAIVIFLAAAAAGRLWWAKLKRIFGGDSAKKSDKNEE